MKVDINTADAATLAAGLNGIGAAKADAIVAYRTENGPFQSVEDLEKVKGIGAKTVELNRDLISVGKPSRPRPTRSSTQAQPRCKDEAIPPWIASSFAALTSHARLYLPWGAAGGMILPGYHIGPSSISGAGTGLFIRWHADACVSPLTISTASDSPMLGRCQIATTPSP